MKAVNTMEVRQQNALNIIHSIECNSGITNGELAQSLGLSVPTISNIVNILKNNGMIIEVGTGASSGGRKPLQLAVNSEFFNYIGVSIAKHTVYLVLIDFAGEICQKKKIFRDFDPTIEYWNDILVLINEFAALVKGKCLVGVAMPGFIDYEKGEISGTYTLGTGSVSLHDIHYVLGDDVTIGDSCRLAGLAQVFGKDVFDDTFFVSMEVYR